MTKSDKTLIQQVLLDYAMIVPKKLESSPVELKSEDFENLNIIKENLLSQNCKHLVTKILLAAAITVSIMATLIACVESIRNFVFDVFDISINVTGVTDDSKKAKIEIEDVYIPKNIANTYKTVLEDYSSSSVTIMWETNGDYTLFSQSIINGTEISMDKNEYSDYGQKMIDGIAVLYVNSDGFYNVVWEEHGYLFLLNASTSLGWEWIEKAITSLEIVDVNISQTK